MQIHDDPMNEISQFEIDEEDKEGQFNDESKSSVSLSDTSQHLEDDETSLPNKEPYYPSQRMR